MKKQSPELQKLNPLVGKWMSEGEVRATGTTPAMKIKGTDIYEWVCEGKFLLHRVDVMMGEEKVEVIEMIGYDADAKNYPMRSFDNQGNFNTMHFTVDEKGVWKITGDLMRSTLTINKDGSHMNAHWEQSEDGSTWKPWMEMKFTKA